MDKRVMLSGNLAGVAYNIAKYLRRSDTDIHLYLWPWEVVIDKVIEIYENILANRRVRKT